MGGKWHHSALLSPERREHTLCCSGSSYRKVNDLSSCVPGSRQMLPSPCLCLGLSACLLPQFCVFSLAHGWDSKFAVLKDPAIVWTCSPPPEGLTASGAAQPHPRRAPWRQKCLEFMVKHSTEATTRLSAIYKHLCPLTMNRCSVAATRFSVFGEATYSFKCTFKYMPKRGTFLPSATQGIPTS